MITNHIRNTMIGHSSILSPLCIFKLLFTHTPAVSEFKSSLGDLGEYPESL